MSTQQQIARLAKVSLMTVSRALRDKPGVSVYMREKIKEIARELDYTLPGQHGPQFTDEIIIGYLIHQNYGMIAMNILRGAAEQARHAKFGLLMMQVEQNPAWIEEAIHSLLDMGIKGLVLAHSWKKPLPRQILVTMRSRGVHLVQVMKKLFTEPLDSVCRNEREYARLAAEHLATLGHRRVLGMDLFQQELWEEQFHLQHIEGTFFFPGAGATLTEQIFETFLRMHPRPTACVISMDNDAFHFSMLAQLHGLTVPDDVSILGMGNFGLDMYPHISTIDIQSREMGRCGIRLLAERIVAGIPPHEITDFQDILLPAQIIDRGSTGPPNG